MSFEEFKCNVCYISSDIILVNTAVARWHNFAPCNVSPGYPSGKARRGVASEGEASLFLGRTDIYKNRL
jgi:hypothetical protein